MALEQFRHKKNHNKKKSITLKQVCKRSEPSITNRRIIIKS